MTLQEWCKQNNKEDLLNEWDYAKNTVTPTEITNGSGKSVWWKCDKEHKWQAVVNSRTRGTGCPYCSGRAVIKGVNDLQTVNHDLAKEWNYEKNDNLKPIDVLPNSGKKVWWKCKFGHEWQSSIYVRNSMKCGCPVCAGKKIVSGINDLLTQHPDVAEEWNYEKNNNLKPTDVAPGSGKKVWWKCIKKHEWEATICDRVRGYGCPYCSGKFRIKSVNDLATTNPDLIKEWNYNKNTISPTEVAAGSNKKVWWKCKEGHEWQAQIKSRVSGTGCPYCKGSLVIKNVNDFATTNPELLSEWNYEKNIINPKEVSAGSNKKVWWKCKKGHEWQSSIYNRTKNNGCPICKKQLIIEGINDFVTTNPILVSEWNYDKNTINPTKISARSCEKVWWKCQFGHEWKAQIRNRVHGAKCPICNKEMKTSFPEQALFFYIKKYYPDAINSNDEIIGMELDIYIPSLKIAIEYDGENWHKDYKNKERELKKNKLCKDNGISLIRIREEGLDLFDDCRCITRTNIKSNNSLSDVIKKVLLDIGNISNIDIDVDRDSTSIYNSYIAIRKSRSLKDTYPDIAKEWHPTKNGKITPDMVYPGTHKKIWWIGDCGHEWQAAVNSRTRGYGCPVCAGKKIVSGVNDLLTLRPDLCEEWYYTKNDEIGLFPNKVPPGTNKKAWWKCKTCGHVWQSTILSRKQGCRCPKCHNKFQKIQCIETGNIYDSLINAAKAIGLKQGDKIGMCCKEKCETVGGYHWKYLDDNK